jgi:hypothetical protein
MRSLVQAFGTTRLGSRDFPSEIFEYSILDFGPMVTGGAFESEERREVSLLPVQHISHSRHSAFTCRPRGEWRRGVYTRSCVFRIQNKRRDRIPVVIISAAAHGQSDGNKLAWDKAMDT